MKITVEVDQNILKGEPPDILTVIIDQRVEGLEDWLDVFKRLLQVMGYHAGQGLEVVDE